jgi:trimeric autotransporter adhesin
LTVSTTSQTTTPAWISGLSTASIAADVAAADVNGTVTYSGLTRLLTDLDATLTSTRGTLNAGELADLKTIVANLNNGMTTSSYLTGIMNALVNGNAANATWTGGAASSTALGNLATGSSATQLSELIGKWFLGTDLPSSTVSMSGYSTFSVSYSPSSSPLFAPSGPSMSDVNQGQIGDCYILSSLAEVASQNSGTISSMFTSNGNNTYGVRFYVNGVAEYVTVNNALTSSFNTGTDIWASPAEKAYAQLQAGGVVTGNTVNYGNSFSTIGNGGAPEYALEEITGATQITDFSASGGSWATIVYNQSFAVTRYTTGSSSAAVLATLAADLAAGDDVLLTSLTNARDSSGKNTLVADHAMSIYGYDSSTGMLQIRNPWGTMAGQYWDTTFEVSVATLLSNGDTITVDNMAGAGRNGGGGAGASAPVVAAQTATQTWGLGQAVNFALASGTFTDPQGQNLTYVATLSSGAALPSWLHFNASTATFTGTVPNTAAGLSIKVTATDTSGLSTSETFSVLTPASAPALVSQTATQTWKLGQAVSFALPSNAFTDPQGEQLTYSATLASGAALPSWLSFNATTKTFTGTVANTATGLSIKVTATDTSGPSAFETFSVLTPATAPTLVSQTATQTWKLGQAVSFTLPSGTFRDPQGEKLTYTATLSGGAALPSWLSFNATTGTFTGTVPNTAAGLSITVTATDTSGLSKSETFSALTPATAPTLTAQTTTQTWKLGQAVNFTLPSNTFNDPQGETLTYSAKLASGAALPSWLSFNTATGTFTGTVANTAKGLSITITATDTSGLSKSETFSVLTPATVPTLTAQTANQSWNTSQAVSLALPAGTFTDPQNETLTYTATQASGAALPSWLKFNAATGTFSGTAPSTASTLSLKVTATDTSGLSVSEFFSATIAVAASKLTQAISSLAPGGGAGSAGLTQSGSGTPPTLASPIH